MKKYEMSFIWNYRKCVLFFCSILFIADCVFAQVVTVHFQIIDQDEGRLMPGRLTVLKSGKPYPLNVPSQLYLAARENTVYTASGSGSFAIAPGKYEFWFGRGMEYSVDIQNIELRDGKDYFLTAKLRKEIDTEGYVGGDMHLHTYTNSGHGDANLQERVISCVAEGLDWAVATDHNFITNYAPFMEQTGIKGLMSTTVGNEVSTSVGHFNTYPLQAESEPVNSKPTDLNLLFDSIRLDAGKDVVIQVNHPRWIASDYFNTKGLDIYFGTVRHPEWNWDFDAIEVLNENYQLGWKTAPDNLQSVKRDWFNLLNHNRRITGLGNSDSHDVVKAIAGVPRNYIASSMDVPSGIDEKELATHIKAQQVSVASGIFTEILFKGKSALGKTVKAGQYGLSLHLKVQAPSWIDCNKVELIRNGVPVKTFELSNNGSAIRLDTLIRTAPDKDSWYLLVASGKRSMYPMVGTMSRPVYPLGFTNPVWVDVRSDGAFISVFDHAKEVVANQADETSSFLTFLEKEPELIPYVFYHLFETKHKNVLSISRVFFRSAGTEQRRMLFRELAKTEMKGAQTLMEAFQEEVLTPLEEVSLASYVLFPIRKNRVENFKAKKNEQLDEQLDFLETKLSYIHSGTVKHEMEVGYNRATGLKSFWEAKIADKNGFFHFTGRPKGHYLLRSEWQMRKDTSLHFYLQSDQKCSLFVNGRKVKVLPPKYKMPVKDKIIEVFLEKGTNELILQIPAQTKSSFCFHPAGDEMLLDPSKKIKETKHKALDKPVEYLARHHFKYHGYGTALTDGFRGRSDYGDQLWQGWEGENADFIIDLEAETTIEEIRLGVLNNQNAWIFFPEKVTFQVDAGNDDWITVFEQKIETASVPAETGIKDVGGRFQPVKTRYVRVIAQKLQNIPDWHKAKGEKAWIFLDEVVVR